MSKPKIAYELKEKWRKLPLLLGGKYKITLPYLEIKKIPIVSKAKTLKSKKSK